MGIAIWSPRLDDQGNSYRGIKFFEKLTAKYSLSIFDQLMAFSTTKIDPTLPMAVMNPLTRLVSEPPHTDERDLFDGKGEMAHAPPTDDDKKLVANGAAASPAATNGAASTNGASAAIPEHPEDVTLSDTELKRIRPRSLSNASLTSLDVSPPTTTDSVDGLITASPQKGTSRTTSGPGLLSLHAITPK